MPPSVKDAEKRLDYLENGLEEFKSRFSEKKMVELLGKALQTEKRHELIGKINGNMNLGFVVLALLQIFVIVLYFFFTTPI